MMKTTIIATALVATLLMAAPVMAQTSTGEIVLVQAGRLLDRPGQAPRGPSTIVIRDG